MHLDKIEGKPDDRVAWGSDIAAQMLRRFGIPYISLNPGASYRGLHDSLVNHLGNVDPGIIICLHEDHSVAIAHGYAKATGRGWAFHITVNDTSSCPDESVQKALTDAGVRLNIDQWSSSPLIESWSVMSRTPLCA